MCAINGILSLVPDPSIALKIHEMNGQVIHRGPDDEGFDVFDERLGMGMRRLSIIDISHGHQPVFNESRTMAIVFNGELYNFRELRLNLEKSGVSFTTNSDTEVLLKMYEHYGRDMFRHLNGMYAFAIHDLKRAELIIGRDRFGEKPLYYYHSKELFIWASELKSLIKVRPDLKELSAKALSLFLTLTYIPAPYTIYEDVKKLEPGHYLVISCSTLKMEKFRYWQTDIHPGEIQKDYTAAKKELKNILYDSVEKRMIADVPLGVFLSGGVDSTIIAAIMAEISPNKIRTFSIGFRNKRYDESVKAQQAATHIGSEHHLGILDYKNLLPDIDKIILNYDEPFADSSAIPTWFVSGYASESVKVALTGDGGDEVFGGYNKYMLQSYGERYQNLVPEFIRSRLTQMVKGPLWKGKDTRSLTSKLKKLIEATGGDPASNHLNIVSLGFKKTELENLMKNPVPADLREYVPSHQQGTDPLKLARSIDMNLSLEGDLLVKVDRASMLCSLECRAPFLDHRLIEFSNQIPDKFLISGNNKKRILKDTFQDLLPKNFFNSPKSGFEVPVADWFRNELKTDLINTLSEESCAKHGYFNYQYISNLLSGHLYKNMDHSYKLWTLYCFQKWYASTF